MEITQENRRFRTFMVVRSVRSPVVSSLDNDIWALAGWFTHPNAEYSVQ